MKTNKKKPWKAFHVTIMEIEGTSEGTPKVGKLANKTVVAGRGKVIRFGRKIRCMYEVTCKMDIKGWEQASIFRSLVFGLRLCVFFRLLLCLYILYVFS